MKITIHSEAELEEVVKAYLLMSDKIKVAFLYGDLGAGKTTFIKKLTETLKGEEEASSPTYSLINEYAIPQGKIYHIDLYRLNDTHEAQEIGIEEYLDSGEYCFIEWPAIIEHLVDQAIVIKIETIGENSRKFEIGLLNP